MKTTPYENRLIVEWTEEQKRKKREDEAFEERLRQFSLARKSAPPPLSPMHTIHNRVLAAASMGIVWGAVAATTAVPSIYAILLIAVPLTPVLPPVWALLATAAVGVGVGALVALTIYAVTFIYQALKYAREKEGLDTLPKLPYAPLNGSTLPRAR